MIAIADTEDRYDDGYGDGYDDGYRDNDGSGYDDGYDEGYSAGVNENVVDIQIEIHSLVQQVKDIPADLKTFDKEVTTDIIIERVVKLLEDLDIG